MKEIKSLINKNIITKGQKITKWNNKIYLEKKKEYKENNIKNEIIGRSTIKDEIKDIDIYKSNLINDKDIDLYGNKDYVINNLEDDYLIGINNCYFCKKDNEEKINNIYSFVNKEKFNKLLDTDNFINECVGDYCNLYFDIEYNKDMDKLHLEDDIINDFCESVEKDFLNIFGIDISKLRIVLEGGEKIGLDGGIEGSYHIIYKLSDLEITFKKNYNIRVFVYYGEEMKLFRKKWGIIMSLNNKLIKNNFIDIIIYDNERFIRCIGQNKLKNVDKKNRIMKIDKKYNKYEINNNLDTLINSSCFISPVKNYLGLYENMKKNIVIEEFEEKWNILDNHEYFKDKEYKIFKKNFKEDIKKLIGNKKWIKDDYISEMGDLLEIRETKDLMNSIDINSLKGNNELIKLMWYFKKIGIKKKEFKKWLSNSKYKGEFEDYWNGNINKNYYLKNYNVLFKNYNEMKELEYFNEDTYDINYNFSIEDIEIILKNIILKNFYKEIIDRRFENYFNINKINHKNKLGIDIIDTDTFIIKDEKCFVNDYTDYLGKYDCLYVKSGLGTGKSFRFINYLKEKYNGEYKGQNKKSIIISPRKTFGSNIKQRFIDENLKVWYYDNKGTSRNKDLFKNESCFIEYEMKNNKFDIFIISPESFKKYFCKNIGTEIDYLRESELIDMFGDNFDTVIIDEVETSFNGFIKNGGHENISNDVNSHYYKYKNKDEIEKINIYSFINLIRKIKKCIFLDGILTYKTVKIINEIMNITRKKELIYINNEISENLKRRFNFVENCEMKKLIDEVIKNINNDRKCFIMFNMNIDLKNFMNTLLLSDDVDLNKEDILFYNRENKNDDIKNVNEEWGKYKIILNTSSLSCGVDYNIDDVFYKCYVYMGGSINNGCSYFDIIQGIYRVRKFKNNIVDVYYNCENNYKNGFKTKLKDKKWCKVFKKDYEKDNIEEYKIDKLICNTVNTVINNTIFEHELSNVKKETKLFNLKHINNVYQELNNNSLDYFYNKINKFKDIEYEINEDFGIKLFMFLIEYSGNVIINKDYNGSLIDENYEEIKKIEKKIDLTKKKFDNIEIIDNEISLRHKRFLDDYEMMKKDNEEEKYKVEKEIDKYNYLLTMNEDNNIDYNQKKQNEDDYNKEITKNKELLILLNNDIEKWKDDYFKYFGEHNKYEIIKYFCKLMEEKKIDYFYDFETESIIKYFFDRIYYNCSYFKKKNKLFFYDIYKIFNINVISVDNNIYNKYKIFENIENIFKESINYDKILNGEKVIININTVINMLKKSNNYEGVFRKMKKLGMKVKKNNLSIFLNIIKVYYKDFIICKLVDNNNYDKIMIRKINEDEINKKIIKIDVIFKCDKCGFRDKNHDKYIVHINTKKHLINIGELEEDYKSYECKECNYLTDNKSKYNRHMKSKEHLKGKVNYECKCCNYVTNNKSKYNRHMKSKEHLKGKVNYECKECKYSTNDKSKYNRHMNSKGHINNSD